jgi:hypothetical protein
MDVVRISKKYAGAQALYELEVEGDDVILEYLKADKTTADYGFKTAHISLPGNIDQVEKAIRIIFSESCKADTPKPHFSGRESTAATEAHGWRASTRR